MRIVVVDNLHLDPENRQRLKNLGEVVIYKNDTYNQEQVIQRLQNANIGLILFSRITDRVLTMCPDLKMLSLWCSGTDHIDLTSATKHRVLICNVPGYAEVAVAEHVFAMILGILRHIPQADKHVRDGQFNWSAFCGHELCGKTLGIFGLGKIGSCLARIAHGFGMKVIACSKTHRKRKENELGVTYVSMDNLLRESDVVSVHAALTSETESIFGEPEFRKMKSSALFVNTARGGIVKYPELADALMRGEIAGACIDVYSHEPPSEEVSLFSPLNVIMTPHIGYNTEEAVRRCTTVCVDNVERFLAGQPLNNVNDLEKGC